MAKNPAKTEATYPSVRELSLQKSDFAGSSLQKVRERVIEFFLFLAALFSIAITVGIVAVLLYESEQFFTHVSIVEFLTDTQWTVLFANPRYGILPLVTGTLVTSMIALIVALPLGTIIAIYLSEYAGNRVREILKPI
jgi:phosphate transport system permease protein